MKSFRTLFIFLFLFIMHPFTISAVDTAFNIDIEYPENQVNYDVTYFDLAIEPSLQQTLNVVISSHSDNVIPVEIAVTNAYTTALGDIDYSPSTARAESLKVALSDILIPEATIIDLQPHEERIIAFNLKVPEKIDAGIILGSVYVKPKLDAEATSGNSDSVQLSSTYAIAKGVKLNYGEVPKPNIDIQSIKTGTFNHKPTFLLTMENIAPVLLKENSKVDIKIKHKESGKEVEFHSDTLSLAPHSQIELPLELEQNEIKSGTYIVDVTFATGDSVFNKTLETTVFSTIKDQTQEIKNPNDAYIPMWMIILVSVMGVIIVAGLLYFIYDKRKHK